MQIKSGFCRLQLRHESEGEEKMWRESPIICINTCNINNVGLIGIKMW